MATDNPHSAQSGETPASQQAQHTLKLYGEASMDAAGRALATQLIDSGALAGSVLFLSGDLGAGKTTFCRGFIRQCGVTDRIKSPTYTLLEQYDTAHATLCHLDLYRIADVDELEYLGFRELLEAQACLLIEWPERAPEIDSLATIRLNLAHVDAESRQLTIQASQSVTERFAGTEPSLQI
jgi:tRNA threonylcarbamoyladenosine biosynthesis protein TsaE